MAAGTVVASILVWLTMLVTRAHATNLHYVIKKDSNYLFGWAEYSVYDTTEKVLKYRIESKFRLRQNNYVRAYPSKEVLGDLRVGLAFRTHIADISLLDPPSNRWIAGNITHSERSKKPEDKYFIYWNGESLLMDTYHTSFYTKLYGQSQDGLLAEFSKRLTSKSKPNQYDLRIFSNKFPDALYFLAFAFENRYKGRFHRGKT